MRRGRVVADAKFEFLAVVKRWSYLIATFGLVSFLFPFLPPLGAPQTCILPVAREHAARVSRCGVVLRTQRFEEDAR